MSGVSDLSDAELTEMLQKQLEAAKAMPPANVPEPAPSGVLQNMGAGFMGAVRPAAKGVGALLSLPEHIANQFGGKVTDIAANYQSPSGDKMSPEAAAAFGYAANVIPQAAASLVGGVLKPGGQAIRSGAEWLMQKAAKPSTADLLSGKGARAVGTMLDEGINATPGGMEKLRGMGMQANQQAADLISPSTATISPQAMASRLKEVADRFTVPGNMDSDLTAIARVGDEFSRHPYVTGPQANYDALAAKLADRQASKADALQIAGRMKTEAAQQENLAHGGGINLRGEASGGQVEHQPFQVGAGGGRIVSPSAYPVPGIAPRIPGRYTHNIDRVPEAEGAYQDAMAVYRTRREEEAAAQAALDAATPNMPVQMAQRLKQAIYSNIRDKYGEVGSASVEAQKALARGAKEEIETAIPEVAPINARASDIWNAHNVVNRRALVAGNRDVIGMAPFAKDPAGMLAFLMGRSPLAQSLAARLINNSQRVPGMVAGTALGAEMGIPDNPDQKRAQAMAELLKGQPQ